MNITITNPTDLQIKTIFKGNEIIVNPKTNTVLDADSAAYVLSIYQFLCKSSTKSTIAAIDTAVTEIIQSDESIDGIAEKKTKKTK